MSIQQRTVTGQHMSGKTDKSKAIILVKSPPPPNLPKPEHIDHKLGTPLDASIQSVLEARETHILKLNNQNVKLQEENDNILNELERVKYEANERQSLWQRSQNELSAKYERCHGDREQLKKTCAELQRDLNELKANANEKDKQIEQLTQEGVKLSKQELNQSNIIKKLRSKEKEVEESVNNLKFELFL